MDRALCKACRARLEDHPKPKEDPVDPNSPVLPGAALDPNSPPPAAESSERGPSPEPKPGALVPPNPALPAGCDVPDSPVPVAAPDEERAPRAGLEGRG